MLKTFLKLFLKKRKSAKNLQQKKIMIKLKRKYAEQILQDQVLQAMIASKTNRNVQSIVRWARTNHEFLTMFDSLATLSEYFKTPIGELLEKNLNSAK
jgi:hypothetical protein